MILTRKRSGDPLQGSNKACCSYREVRLCSQGVQTLQPLYQKYGHFDEALEMERKAYASQLMLNDQTGDTKIILSSALGVFGVMSLLLGLLWKKNKFVYSQLTTFKDEMLRKEAESDKLMLQCNYLEEKYQSLQQHIYESSPVVSKVRQ